ncbi:helix-turn-helix transcriptional regulator [Phycicoccus avicenniae]|uniref:helix-turn-helix transcriptional regulator n=1 Tax=Phycicoccus avicenniae TaxID=2828860 RepID=UPI003D27BB9D
MRASRLLLMLLLLQNRGRMTADRLAAELEVSRRTVLRDVEALSAAGLPVLVRPGRGGGIELGFSYRTRLTGLAADEAEALGVLLARPSPELAALGLAAPAARAGAKLLESLPDPSRAIAQRAGAQFRVVPAAPPEDERVPALVDAVRRRRVVRLRARGDAARTVHPVGLVLEEGRWALVDALDPEVPVPLEEWGTVNISARGFG